MLEHEGIESKDEKYECAKEASTKVNFDNSHNFAYELFHRDAKAAKAVYEELRYWLKEQE